MPSPVLVATFAATSSSGERARLGMIVFCNGRIAAVATALTAAITRTTRSGASSASAMAATTLVASATR